MRKLTILLTTLCVVVSINASAQRGERSRKERRDRSETVTDTQKEQIKSILSNYDPDSLTAEDAKAIHEAFREAELRGGPAIEATLKEAGFDPDTLRELAPSSNRQGKGKRADKKNEDNNTSTPQKLSIKGESSFAVNSTAVDSDGSLSIEYTGDGKGISMPVQWTNAPEDTKCFALNLWHLPQPTADPSEVKSYWVLYNIPADITSLSEATAGIGSDGYNDKDTTGYDPMRSKGPGVKEYNLTLYALSDAPIFTTTKVYRSDLLKAIDGIILDETTLKYTYEREQGNETGETPGETTETLTDEQQEKVTSILSQYDPSALTAEDAKAIQEAFREAELRGGPALDAAIESAGFDPEALRELAPPPKRKQRNASRDS